MAGKVVAVTVFATFVGLVVWGLAYDVRQRFEARHGRQLLQELAEKERRADLYAVQARLRTEADEVRDEIETFDALARQLEEIRNLPEFHGELA